MCCWGFSPLTTTAYLLRVLPADSLIAGSTRSYKNSSAHKYRYFFALIAVSMPCIIAVGVGGQPLTTTSTGITLETLPQLA